MPLDWIYGLIGGVMIGCAGALYLLVNGRIMGASGILGSVVDGSAGASARTERLAFLAALLIVPGLIGISSGAETFATSNIAVLVAAGLLVGIGTRIANGCTSGHGVCGISRLSPRGLVATILYILAGGLTVLVFKHMLGVA